MRFRPMLLPLLAVALLGACTATAVGSISPSAQAPTPPASNPPSAAGGGMIAGTFVSTSVAGHDLVKGTTVTLTFKDGQLSANAGCNTMSGTVVVLGGKLSVGQMAMTEMGCAAELMAQDQWLAAFLPGATADFGPGYLNLTKDGVTIKLVNKQTTNLPIEGTTWTVSGLIAGDTASSIQQGVVATLVFSGGKVTVNTGCNTGGGTATIADGKITFGPIVLTRMACTTWAGAVEKAMTTVLTGTQPYTIDGSSLTIGGTSGQPGLMLTGTK